MLIYHPESDALFWDAEFKFEGADGALCYDVSEELWAVERADLEGIEFPEIERHLAYLKDMRTEEVQAIEAEVDMYWNMAHPDDEYWGGL